MLTSITSEFVSYSTLKSILYDELIRTVAENGSGGHMSSLVFLNTAVGIRCKQPLLI